MSTFLCHNDLWGHLPHGWGIQIYPIDLSRNQAKCTYTQMQPRKNKKKQTEEVKRLNCKQLSDKTKLEYK